MKQFISLILAFVSISCITGCSKYGTPICDFELKGKVKNQENSPVENIQIVINEPYSGYVDTVYTDDAGDFRLIVYENSGNIYHIKAVDTDGEENEGKYKEKNININLEKE